MSKEKITALELLITKLQKVREDADQCPSNRTFAASLLGHYMEYKTLTHKQRTAALNLVNRTNFKKKIKTKKEKTYYLYAMTAGKLVKLGVSTDVKKRKKQLQTGNGEVIKCVWTFVCGTHSGKAYANERKLHRYCSKYRVNGEWFSNECLPLVKEFKVK